MPADSVVHSTAAHAKILAVVGYVFVVVATPREWVPAFVGYAAAIIAALLIARVPWRRAATGLLIEVPFLAFAVLLPFVSGMEGMWAAWNILAKASLGVLAATLLAATTLPVDLVAGLQRLRLPAPIVAIFSFFIRYVDVVADEFVRMRIAQQSRGLQLSSARSWAAVARGLGALFVRSYERGERVHLALISRGYDGRIPSTDRVPAAWWPSVALPFAAVLVLAATAVMR